MIVLTQEQTALRDALKRSNTDSRLTDILRLKLEGLTHQQIAERLNVSTSTINRLSSLIKRA